MFGFIRKWLRIERPQTAALHPSRTLEVRLPFDAAFRRCIAGIETLLGGVVRESQSERGYIEATFGLMFSERLTCTLDRIGDESTRVIIESRRGALGEPAKPSLYVDSLAQYVLAAHVPA